MEKRGGSGDGRMVKMRPSRGEYCTVELGLSRGRGVGLVRVVMILLGTDVFFRYSISPVLVPGRSSRAVDDLVVPGWPGG